MSLRDIPIIPKGRCPKALDITSDYVDKLEKEGVLKFESTPTRRKYISMRSLESAANWLRSSRAG